MMFQNPQIRDWIQRGVITAEGAKEISLLLSEKELVKSQEQGDSLDTQILHAYNTMLHEFSQAPLYVLKNAIPIELFERSLQVARDYENQKIKPSIMSQIFTLLDLKVSQGFFVSEIEQESYYNNVLQARKLGETETLLLLISHQEVLAFTFLMSCHRKESYKKILSFLERFKHKETEEHVALIRSQIEKDVCRLSVLKFLNHEKQEFLEVFYFSTLEKMFFLYEYRNVSYLVPLRL